MLRVYPLPGLHPHTTIPIERLLYLSLPRAQTDAFPRDRIDLYQIVNQFENDLEQTIWCHEGEEKAAAASKSILDFLESIQ
jgi:hypothetical protein